MKEEPILYWNKDDDYLYLYHEAAKKIGRDALQPYRFLDEKDDLVFSRLKRIETLYHYCSIDTMKKIVDSKSLWLKNCQNVNDTKEMSLAIDILEKNITFILNNSFLNISTKEQLLESIKYQIDYVHNCSFFPENTRNELSTELKRYESNVNASLEINIDLIKDGMTFFFHNLLKDLRKHISPTYISCFSSKKDDLGQWRGYGNNGQGVAIGFSVSSLNSDKLKEKGVRLKEVVYHENLQTVITQMAFFDYFLNQEKITDWAYNILPVFKSFAFKEEHESRLIFVAQKEAPILQYILPLDNDYIIEIVLGPKCTIPKEEIKKIFNSAGFNISENQINESEIPYL